MKIYCMSDIHGCLAEFENALALVTEHLSEDDTMLLLLGDYIHGGADNQAVLDKIISLQKRYGSEKVVALLGNHENFVLEGHSTLDEMERRDRDDDDNEVEDCYLTWMESLPDYYIEGNTLFIHAGIEEDAAEYWEWATDRYTRIEKYPAEIGQIPNFQMKIVAGHVGTAVISGNPSFHDIYYDGASHYYIDGTVLTSGWIPVLLVDTDADRYYRVTEGGKYPVEAYEDWC